MSERGVRGEAGPGGGASPGSAGRPGRRRRRGRARGPAGGREAPRRRRAGGGGPGPAGGSAAAARLLPARAAAAAAAPAAPAAAGGAVRAARRPPRLSGPLLPPGLALRAGRRLRLPCSSAAAALFISSHRLPLGPRRRVRGGEPRSRRRRLGAAAAAERELAKGGVRTKPAGDPGSRATSPPSSSSPTPPSSPVSLASPPSPGSLALTAMAAADRGSARHWLTPRHVTGAGRAGGRGADGGGAAAAAARRRLTGGAAELIAAGFSGRETKGDAEREKEVRAAAGLPSGRRPASPRLLWAARLGRRAPPPRGAQIFAVSDREPLERQWRPQWNDRVPLACAPDRRRPAGVVGARCGPGTRSKCSGECLVEVALRCPRFTEEKTEAQRD